MTIRQRLAKRINMDDIREVISLVQNDDRKKQELYDLLSDSDPKTAYYAAWVMSHFPSKQNKWLLSKQDELIDQAMDCAHPGLRRQLLTILYRQPLTAIERVDFLDFCLERMLTLKEPLAVQSLCMKIAYELCRPIPELMQELKAALDLVEEEELSPAILAARRNILQAIKKGKSLNQASL